jgi:phosphonate transport system ATP-binding protein
MMVGVIGRSGAGKSTLLRMINRLTDATSGAIHRRGRDVTALRGAAMRAWQARLRDDLPAVQPRAAARRRVERAARDAEPPLDAGHDVQPLPADIHRAIDILDRLGIAEQPPKRAEALSGGQQQRVAIARALMQDPRLIILADEPIASLDPMNAQIVMDDAAPHPRGGRAHGDLQPAHARHRAALLRPRDRHARGRVVFDGTPTTHHRRRARHLRRRRDFSEAATSTAIAPLETPAAAPGPRGRGRNLTPKPRPGTGLRATKRERP